MYQRNRFKRICFTLLTLTLSCSITALAEDWKDVAKEKGVELTYVAEGNLARLRFNNTNSEPVIVRWTTSVQLASGKRINAQNELSLDGGETQVVSAGPFRDAGVPAQVKNVTGSLRTKMIEH